MILKLIKFVKYWFIVCILCEVFVWIDEYICVILFLWIKLWIVGILIIILWVVIWLLLIFLSNVCEIMVCNDLDSIDCIMFFFLLGNMLMIWLIVFGVEVVCKVLNIKWLVFVVVIVRWIVLRLCSLLIKIILGFLCNVFLSVFEKLCVLWWILCWLIKFNLFLCMNLIGFLIVKIWWCLFWLM